MINRSALAVAAKAIDSFASYDTPAALAEDCIAAYLAALKEAPWDMRAEMHVDEVTKLPVWLLSESDGRDVTESDVVELAADTFRPGTVILITEPKEA